jgi:SAM-dependent methyltransferase
LNLFLWHLNEFKKNRDPRPEFVKAFKEAIKILSLRKKNKLLKNNFFPSKKESYSFENYIQSLFSDIWQNMTDDIYFDQTFNFTKTRFLKSGINLYNFFKNKIVLDAGCGSGKFSSAIAKFKAKKVFGIDIGKTGLDFAKQQKKKREYCKIVSYKYGSILNLPFKKNSIDIVWSNGVIHHTTNYSKCLKEFSRLLKKNGRLFLYVNGSMGLYEILQDKIRIALDDIPKEFILSYLKFLGVNSGRLYWLQDMLNAPYEYKEINKIKKLLKKNGFIVEKQLLRGVKTDQIEQKSAGLPYGDLKYGDAQVKFICNKV